MVIDGDRTNELPYSARRIRSPIDTAFGRISRRRLVWIISSFPKGTRNENHNAHHTYLNSKKNHLYYIQLLFSYRFSKHIYRSLSGQSLPSCYCTVSVSNVVEPIVLWGMGGHRRRWRWILVPTESEASRQANKSCANQTSSQANRGTEGYKV